MDEVVLEHRLTTIEAKIDSLVSSVQTWGAAQNLQNGNVAKLQHEQDLFLREYRKHIADTLEHGCPLLSRHVAEDAAERAESRGRRSVWRLQYAAVVGAFGLGGGLVELARLLGVF